MKILTLIVCCALALAAQNLPPTNPPGTPVVETTASALVPNAQDSVTPDNGAPSTATPVAPVPTPAQPPKPTSSFGAKVKTVAIVAASAGLAILFALAQAH